MIIDYLLATFKDNFLTAAEQRIILQNLSRPPETYFGVFREEHKVTSKYRPNGTRY